MLKGLSKLAAGAVIVMTTSAAVAGISDLKAGDVLAGIDQNSGKACELQVTAVEQGAVTAILSANGLTYVAVKMERPNPFVTTYNGTYSRQSVRAINGVELLKTVDGQLSQNIFSDKINFLASETYWSANGYRSTSLIECPDLKLK